MNQYLQHQTLFAPQIERKPSGNLGMVIVIPCYNEPELLFSLMALRKCTLPRVDVEVIVLINDSLTDAPSVKKENAKAYEMGQEWARQNFIAKMRFQFLYHRDLPTKSAGVGLARKIGMDEACFRLEKVKHPRGIIVCFDADSKCDRNYLLAIEEHFKINPKTEACSIHYEHPLSGHYFEEEIYTAIAQYELHLRYYVHAQRYAGFPFAYQTIGSSMAVRCNAYQKQGGMNKRKAGEDFYFLHKFSVLGTLSELKTTKVIPSPRKSDRVPFGTGKAVGDLLAGKKAYQSYHLQSFVDLKVFFAEVPNLFKLSVSEDLTRFLESLPPVVQAFLQEVNFEKHLLEIQKNTKQASKFVNRFYRWFNAFMLMKYVHFSRDHYYPDQGIEAAAQELLQLAHGIAMEEKTAKALLKKYRKIDQEKEAV